MGVGWEGLRYYVAFSRPRTQYLVMVTITSKLQMVVVCAWQRGLLPYTKWPTSVQASNHVIQDTYVAAESISGCDFTRNKNNTIN